MDKREAKREYKEAKIAAGVYRVHNTADDRSLVGASVNVNAILNRHRAGLRMGAHENKDLQSDWNRLGETSFAFEVLDTLTGEDKPGFDVKRELATLEQLWLERFEPYGERGYNRRAK
ncbi:MAG TPA: GIY-YIG nuclease family protein [Thermoanaerobaculia bacterium]|nr:GIY-YIG nuclease family protein [Thermoanaerobaculia bacterium]